MKNEHYYIMHKDTVVCEYKNGSTKVINKALSPLLFRFFDSFEDWLVSRAIDGHRPNSRLLKKALRLAGRDDISAVIAAYALTITDNYWVKKPNEEIKYNNIRFKENMFAELALSGSYDSFNKAAASGAKRPYTPDLTNTGSYEKCWRMENGRWCMYKKANESEAFSEVFVSKLCRVLGFDAAEYTFGKDCVKTFDFTDNASVDFEPAYNFVWDNDDMIYNIDKLRTLSEDKTLVRDLMRIFFMDALTANPDRHTFNYGVLRDAQSGDIISLAPNFDNNMALTARNDMSDTKRENDFLIGLFNETLEYVKDFEVPKITRELILSALDEYEISAALKSKIADFIYNGYTQIKRSDF